MIKYALAAALAASLVMGGLLYRETRRAANAEMEAAELRGDLAQCAGRIGNIMEDQRDDATVDDPDFDIPCEWMLEGCSGSD